MVIIYADGCNLEKTKELYDKNIVEGYTTNPTLMKKEGITNYEKFIKDFIEIVPDKPVSFMILTDYYVDDIIYQAEKISSFGDNIYVKIPVTNTYGQSNVKIIHELSEKGIKINITSVFTFDQLYEIMSYKYKSEIIISVFTGRIMNTHIDPKLHFDYVNIYLRKYLYPNIKTLWASSRELYNIRQAKDCKADIITLSYDLIDKLNLIGKNLTEYSIETTKMFYNDGKGYEL